MHSNATTVDAYLESLPPARREAISAVREVILANLPEGYEEVMRWGMICYEVPLATCPDTYNGEPLMYAALASQKRHMAVYLTAIYADPDRAEDFARRYRETGKRLDMGKSCVRFTKLEHLPLELVGEVVASTPVADMVAIADGARKARRRAR